MALVALAVVLAVVYLYGGLAKLRCPRLLRGTLMAVGLNRSSARLLARALPVIEIGGALVIIGGDARVRQAAVALLALILMAGMALAWRIRGDEVPCACLGPGDPATLGTETWWRNGLLLVLSAAVALASAPSAVSVATSSTDGVAAVILIGAATALALHLHLHLARQRSTLDALPGLLHSMQQATLHRSLGAERLPRRVANLTVHDVDGRTTNLRSLSRHRTQLLIITEPDCSACAAVLPHIGAMQERLGELAEVRAVSLESLCNHLRSDTMPTGSLFVADARAGQMWLASLLAQGTPAVCVLTAGMLLSHDALSETHDLDALAAQLAEN